MEARKNGNYIGKRILVIFEDGKDHFAKKDGVCTDSNEQEIILDHKHIVPRSRVVRMEVI